MLKREYYPSDTIKLINQSEGRTGSTGKAAHAIAQHLMAMAPGAVLWNVKGSKIEKVGIGEDGFRDRFKDSPGTANSGWLGKGDMALLLCEVLNSDVGQAALGALDSGVTRAEVHYLNLKQMAKMLGSLGKIQMKSSNWVVTPATVIDVQKTFTKKDGTSFTKTVPQKVPKTVAPVVQKEQLAMVHAVLDNLGGNLHLQTFFPDTAAEPSSANWVLGTVNVTVTFDTNGKPVTATRPR
jgi:hypothetical protein